MAWRTRRITESDLAAAVKGAVADATLSATFTAHAVQCTKDKEEIRQALASQNINRQEMHAETQRRFSKLERAVYIAVGFGMAISFLSSHVGDIIKALR